MKRQRALLYVLGVFLLGSVALSSGCASIISKSVYPVEITSSPTGADFVILKKNGETKHQGKTPQTVDLKAGRGYFLAANYTVKFSMPGYKEVTVPIDQGLDAWYLFGNFLIGGLIGWVIVDPITGAMWTLKDLHVTLQPAESAAAGAPVGVDNVASVRAVGQYLLAKIASLDHRPAALNSRGHP